MQKEIWRKEVLLLKLDSEIRLNLFKFIQEVKPCRDSDIHFMFLKCLDDDTVELRGDYSVLTLNMEDVMVYSGLETVVSICGVEGIEIDTFYVRYNCDGVIEYELNCPEKFNGYYYLNKDNDKLNIFFDKDWYMSLGEHEQKMIKSNFLFSRAIGGWVSRCKIPNLWSAEDVCKRLWLEDRCSVGGKSFEEKMQDKAERAERRIEKYNEYSENAIKRGKERQKPLNDMHGDIAFFTQPNINTSSGRAFSKRREKMFESYFKGFEEFRKSEYWKDRIEAAETTISGTKPTDVAFIDRRIKETDSAIKKVKGNLDVYKARLEKVQSGQSIKRYNGTVLTEYEIAKYILDTEYQLEMLISKSVYYYKCLEDAGGISFSKENIKKGYKIQHKRWGVCEVCGTGPKNFTYVILEGGAKGMGGSCPYAEILEIVSTEVKEDCHPFKVGEVYTVKEWDGNSYVPVTYTVVKVSEKSVTLESENCKKINRKPKKSVVGGSTEWLICVTDSLSGTIRKSE